MKKFLFIFLFMYLFLLSSCGESPTIPGLPPKFSLGIVYPNPAKLTDTITLAVINYGNNLKFDSKDSLYVTVKNGNDIDTLKITYASNRDEQPEFSIGNITTNPYIESIIKEYRMIIQCDIRNLNKGHWTIEVIGGKEKTTSKIGLLVFN